MKHTCRRTLASNIMCMFMQEILQEDSDDMYIDATSSAPRLKCAEALLLSVQRYCNESLKDYHMIEDPSNIAIFADIFVGVLRLRAGECFQVDEDAPSAPHVMSERGSSRMTARLLVLLAPQARQLTQRPSWRTWLGPLSRRGSRGECPPAAVLLLQSALQAAAVAACVAPVCVLSVCLACSVCVLLAVCPALCICPCVCLCAVLCAVSVSVSVLCLVCFEE